MTAHFNDIRALLKEELEGAKIRIQVAVAWFTDQQLYDILLQKANESVAVTVVIRNDIINLNSGSIKWQKLIDAEDATLYLSGESLGLHHKFCIIDNRVLISGSYNWTYHAQRNRENVICGSQPELVKAFDKEFNDLLDNARQAADIKVSMAEYPPVATDALLEEASIETEFKAEAHISQALVGNYRQIFLAANSAYRQKKYELAEELVKRAMNIKPNGVEAFSLMAGIYWRTKRFDAAIEVAQKAERHGLKDAELWNVCGLALEGLKRFREAIEYYNRSISIEPDLSTYYSNKCFALDASGRESLADGVVHEAIRVANAEIKKYGDGKNNYRLLQAYITCANVRSDRPEKRKYAQAASEIFSRMPADEQDLHDLDDIKRNLK